MMHGGSFECSVHYYEATGFYLPVLNNKHASYSLGPDRKAVGVGANATLTITGKAGETNSFITYNPSHYPAWGFYAYVTTGDRWWLDELQSHTISILLNSDPSTTSGAAAYTRNQTHGTTTFYGTGAGMALASAVRGLGWFTRTLVDAAWSTPDSDRHAQYMADLVKVSHFPALAEHIQSEVTAIPNKATLGWMAAELGEFSLIAPWMQDYTAIACGMAVKREYVDLTNLFFSHLIVKNVVGRFANGCPYSASPYRMTQVKSNLRDTPTNANICTSWSEVYVGSATDIDRELFTSGCPGSGIHAAGGGGWEGNGAGHRYPNISHAMLGIANHIGITSAATPLAYMAANMTGSDADKAGGLQWSIRP